MSACVPGTPSMSKTWIARLALMAFGFVLLPAPLAAQTPEGVEVPSTICDRTPFADWGTVPDAGDGLDERPAIDVLYFQGPCNPRLVPGKPALVRVYLNWRQHSSPAPMAVDSYDVNVRLTSPSGVVPCAVTPTSPIHVKRPALYNHEERKQARNSINFFGCILDGLATITAEVTFPANPEIPPIRQVRRIEHMKTSPVVHARVVFPTVGSWSDGVPADAITRGTALIEAGREFAMQNLPLADINLRIDTAGLKLVEPHLEPDSGYEEVRSPCGNPEAVVRETCRRFVHTWRPGNPFLRGVHFWLADRLTSTRASSALTIAVVPADFQGGFQGIHIPPPGFFDVILSDRAADNTFEISERPAYGSSVIIIRDHVTASTVAHELGHYLGLPHHAGSDRDRLPEIEGFLLAGNSGVNKSFVEGNGDPATNRLRSLMHVSSLSELAIQTSFIMNGQYKALAVDLDERGMPRRPRPRTLMRSLPPVNPQVAASGIRLVLNTGFDRLNDYSQETVLRLLARAAGPQSAATSVVVRGLMSASGDDGYLAPLEWRPGTEGDDGASPEPRDGRALVRVLDTAGGVLDAVPIELRFTTDDQTRPADADEEPRSFSVGVRLPAGARLVQLLSRTGVVLAESRASASAPAVRLATPAAGSTWTPGTPIRWEANDPDGDPLRYSVFYSPDGGAEWSALALGVTTRSVDVTALNPGPAPMIAVAVTDGFHVAADVIPVRPLLEPSPVSRRPADGDVAFAGATIRVQFNTDLAPASIAVGALRLEDADRLPVAARATYDEASRVITLVPDRPLTAGSTYTVRVPNGLRDLYGNTSSSHVDWTFRVEPDLGPPAIERIRPATGALAIPLDAVVTVRFTEPVDAGSLRAIRLTGPEGVDVAGAIDYDAETRTATFRPAAPLQPRTRYEAAVPASVIDVHGNRLVEGQSVVFTTGVSVRSTAE